MNNDSEVMLIALSKERDELHDKLMHVDRIIKKIKDGEYFGSGEIIRIEAKSVAIPNRIAFPKHTDTKVIVLKAMDNIGQVVSLRQIQEEYTMISGNKVNIRDTVRSLNKSGLLLMMKEKASERGIYWVKKEWIENGEVLDQHKPEGFDLLYKPENLLFL
jgi:hypothetical protein